MRRSLIKTLFIRNKLALISFGVFFIVFINSSFAINVNNESDREAIISERYCKFYKDNFIEPRYIINFRGYYDSDHNSHDYYLRAGYRQSSYQMINNLSMTHESKYRDRSINKKKYREKKAEEYDLKLSSKIRIKDQKNYIALYNRTLYDEYSKYYSDIQSAAGIGRYFYNQGVSLDLSIGYRDVKNFGYAVNFIPSFRVNYKINNNLRIVQRAYLYIDHKSIDNEILTRFIRRVNDKLSFEIAHLFEQRKYESTNKGEVNQVKRRITIGMNYIF